MGITEKEKTLKLYNEHLVDINIRIVEARDKIRNKIRYKDEMFFLDHMLKNRGNIKKAILNMEKLPIEVWKGTEVKYIYI